MQNEIQYTVAVEAKAHQKYIASLGTTSLFCGLLDAASHVGCSFLVPGTGKTVMQTILGLAMSRARIWASGKEGKRAPAVRIVPDLDAFRSQAGRKDSGSYSMGCCYIPSVCSAYQNDEAMDVGSDSRPPI